MSEEEYQAKLAEIDGRINKVIEEVKATNEPHNSNPFWEADIISEVLIEAAQKGSVNAVKATFAKEDYQITDELAKEIYDMARAAGKLPTGYFEAKPQRAVGFDEVRAVVVPNTMDQATRSRLEGAGMNVVEYTAGDEESRKEALNSVPDVKFSVRDQKYLAAVESGDMETAEQMVREAANEAGYTSPKLYHGTPEFGFTEIDFKKLDDKISFFMTDSVGTAMSYAGTDKVLEIGGTISEEDLEEAVDRTYDDMHEAADSVVYALRKLGSEWAVEHEYVSKGVEKIAERLIDGEISKDDADSEMDEFCADVLFDVYEYTKNYDEEVSEMEFWEFEEYAGEKGYHDVVVNATRAVFRYADAYNDLYIGSNRGIYAFYANTDGYLEVDAAGKKWNEIGYDSGEKVYNNTRSVAI
jgi:hypothetical protein